MVKYLLIAGIAFASAVFAFDEATCLVPVDNTGAAPTSTAYIPTPSGHRDVIYDDQTLDLDAWWNAYSIYGANGYEPADDFETTADSTLEMVRFWVMQGNGFDIRVDIFDDSGAGPGSVLYQEEVPGSDITWTIAYQDFYDTIWEADIPISGFDIVAGTRYWLGLQSTSGGNKFWCVMLNEPEWWSNCYFYYYGTWYDSEDFFSEASACMFELHGTLTDHEEPVITQTYPHDSDFPSGVPVDTNVTFHVTDDLSGCDTDETTCSVEESGGAVPGDLAFDDSDPLDVAFTWEPEDHYAEGADVDVTVETYDLAGNGPVTESWSFTTGYTNVAPASLGVIKAGFIE